MNRNEAKIFASIPREKLAVIEPKLDKHYDLICAFANGAEIEVFRGMGYWEKQEEPKFLDDFKYRVKRNTQPAEPWKPKDGEKYYCVSGDGDVVDVDFDANDLNDMEYVAFGNCFRTLEEAEAAR